MNESPAKPARTAPQPDGVGVGDSYATSFRKAGASLGGVVGGIGGGLGGWYLAKMLGPQGNNASVSTNLWTGVTTHTTVANNENHRYYGGIGGGLTGVAVGAVIGGGVGHIVGRGVDWYTGAGSQAPAAPENIQMSPVQSISSRISPV